MGTGRSRSFDRCPRCRKSWGLFSVYRCASCGTAFCAGCDLDESHEKDLNWLTAAVAETRVDRCPACRCTISDADRIGVIRAEA